MSRFFRSGEDSSSESSSDEEELYSEEEEETKKDEGSEEEDSDESEEDEDESDEESSDDEGIKRTGASRFLRGESSESEDSDEDQPKTVKSAKDKRFAELEATIDTIEKKQKINDWGAVSNGMLSTRQDVYITDNLTWYRIRQAYSTSHQDDGAGPGSQALHQGYCRTRRCYERNDLETEGHPEEDECY